MIQKNSRQRIHTQITEPEQSLVDQSLEEILGQQSSSTSHCDDSLLLQDIEDDVYEPETKTLRKRVQKFKSKRPQMKDEYEGEQRYTFNPVLAASDKKVRINSTDMSKLTFAVLDSSKDVPLKKPQSAYVLFGNEQREVIQEKYPGIKVTQVVKMIAVEWQKLTKLQRQKYKDAAKRDKDRFAQELTKLSRVGDDTLLYQMPKKPLTSYMFFVRETRVRIAREMPDIPPLNIMKEVGKVWQRQTQKDLVKYSAAADADQIRYQNELHDFISHINKLRQSFSDSSSPQNANEKSNSTANVTPVKPQSAKTFTTYKAVIKPKKPLSAYIFYSQEQRDLLKKEHPHYSTREVMKQVSGQWAQMPKDQRLIYAEMASDDKRRFESEMKSLRCGGRKIDQEQVNHLDMNENVSLPLDYGFEGKIMQKSPKFDQYFANFPAQTFGQQRQDFNELSPLQFFRRDKLFEFNNF